jgi:hypothetical protein
MGDVQEVDNFLDGIIMTTNVEETHEDYRKIIQYLVGMKNPARATKVMQTRIVHKDRNYLIIGD